MKKANTRMIAILALGMYISLLVTGCKSQDKNINSSDQNVNLHTEVSEIDHSSQAIDKSIISNQNNNILFDAIFIPMAESRIEPSFDDLKAAASLNGLNCIDEAGVTVILDKTSPDSYGYAESLFLKMVCFRPAREGLFSPDPNMVSANQLGRGTRKDVKNIENR